MGENPATAEFVTETQPGHSEGQAQDKTPGLFSLIGTAFSDFSELVHARMDLTRANIAATFRTLAIAGLAILIGTILCLAAFITLLIGIAMALAPLMGTLPAALTVSLISAGIGALLALSAIKRFTRQLSATLPGKGGKKEKEQPVNGEN